MNILIVYGTTEGQTRNIARTMEDLLQRAGHRVAIADAADEPPAPQGYDAVLVGASIHIHNYQGAVMHYIREHATALNAMPTAFFSVCMAVASDMEEEHEEARKIARNFLEKAGWKPMEVTHIAGSLKFSKYDFFKRLVMKSIARKEGHEVDPGKDYEYTDWNAVRTFVTAFAEKAGASIKPLPEGIGSLR